MYRGIYYRTLVDDIFEFKVEKFPENLVIMYLSALKIRDYK